MNAAKPGTVGRRLDNVEIRFAEDGELIVRAADVTTGYYRETSITASEFREGWFCTGEIAHIDADSYLASRAERKSSL